jgi:hypothetical protein
MSEQKKSNSTAGVVGTIVFFILVIILGRSCGGMIGKNAAERHFKERQGNSGY